MESFAARLPSWVALTTASLLFCALSLWEMCDETVTNDEIVHLTAGYTYLARRDYRLNPEHPALTKILAGIPLRFMDLNWPRTEEFWVKSWQWQHGYHFFYQSGNDANRLLFWGRIPMLFWSLLLIATVYALARDLFGPLGALVSLALATFSPILLGHGHLVTTDVPVAALILLSAAALRRLVEAPSLGAACVAGVLLGGALAAKYNAVVFLPAFAWYLLADLWRRSGLSPCGWMRRDVLRLAGYLAIIGGGVLLVIWAVYGFRYAASPDSRFEFGWYFDRTRESFVGRTLEFARRARLLPEAYLHGFWYMFEHAQARTAFALGQLSPTGWWWYFPFAYLVKTPVTALVLTLGGGAAAFRDRRCFFVLIPLIIYGIVAAGSNINIGLRHILPILPFLMVLAGGLPYRRLLFSTNNSVRVATIAFLLLIPTETIAAGPYFLAYFNAPSALAAPRHDLLSDSNLDWGQDLHRLKRWMDERRIESIKLGYFGNGSPRQLGLRHQRLIAANMYQEYEPEWPFTSKLAPGDWVAVSVTNYTGIVLGPRAHYYRKLLAGLEPVAAVGYSILVFHIPPGWSPPQ